MTYCYELKSGEIVERAFPVGKAPMAIRIKGETAKRSYEAESKSVPAPAGWPIECVASGVHPEQAGELRKHLADRGVATEITPSGNPIYTDAQHRRKALKARGMVDRSSFI